tara:strand:+ start:451 stop:1917 length:1467 start_codon:yes stop_codon:yes gene_type:complete
MAKGVTPQSSDASKWYTDVITKAQLADYGPVKGTMVIRPYGYSIWESIRDEFDKRFKQTNHTNAYFPLFIPKSFLAKEAEHVEGFAKECAVVTHSKLKVDNQKLVVDPDSKLEEEIIVRPTSETVIWSMYKKWINSYRDLPILINQWANVVRWEMRTRLFLRTSEFLWQEGHTAHATEKEAIDEALKILDIYKDVVENIMAIPVLTGYKSESEKFAGAVETYCIEAMMGDKKALQAGTSHYLGQNFAKAFDVKFQNENNQEEYVYATSWGVSTRLIGALIMVHGDDQGLRLPPKVAPIQIVIVPIYKTDEDKDKIQNYIQPLIDDFDEHNIRYFYDDRAKMSPGFKFNEWEMKGVPVRIEVGMRDINDGLVVFSRRDNNLKDSIKIDEIKNYFSGLLLDIQSSLFTQAKQFQNNNTHDATNYQDFQSLIKDGGFVKCGWDGTTDTENAIKKDTKATIRCIPFSQKIDGLKCIYSNNPAKYEVIFSRAY